MKVSKRIQLSKEVLDKLINGEDVLINTSDKRAFLLGTKSALEVKLQALKERHARELAALESK